MRRRSLEVKPDVCRPEWFKVLPSECDAESGAARRGLERTLLRGPVAELLVLECALADQDRVAIDGRVRQHHAEKAPCLLLPPGRLPSLCCARASCSCLPSSLIPARWPAPACGTCLRGGRVHSPSLTRPPAAGAPGRGRGGAAGGAAPGTAGLVIGPPEHDFSGDTSRFTRLSFCCPPPPPPSFSRCINSYGERASAK